MKRFFTVLLFFSAIGVQGSDTLTRAQVYNFSIGDTFEYKTETIYDIYTGEGIIYDNVSFTRVVVVGVHNYQAQDSIVIIEKIYEIASNDSTIFVNTDTISIDSSFNYAVYSAPNFQAWHFCGINIDSGYNQRTVNFCDWSCGNLGVWGDSVFYAQGLGKTATHIYDNDGTSTSETYDTSLIYFSKGGETWGTPATIAVGISNVTTQQPSITLFPSINSGQFKIKIANGNCTTYQLAVYELTGREVKRATLNNGINDIDMPYVSKGMYLWNVTSQGTLLQSGKMVVN